MVRLFVAIDLPYDIREQLCEVQSASGRAGHASHWWIWIDSYYFKISRRGKWLRLPRVTDLLQTIEVSPFSHDDGFIGTNSNNRPVLSGGGRGPVGRRLLSKRLNRHLSHRRST